MFLVLARQHFLHRFPVFFRLFKCIVIEIFLEEKFSIFFQLFNLIFFFRRKKIAICSANETFFLLLCRFIFQFLLWVKTRICLNLYFSREVKKLVKSLMGSVSTRNYFSLLINNNFYYWEYNYRITLIIISKIKIHRAVRLEASFGKIVDNNNTKI